MITTVKFATTALIHASKDDTGTLCGSEVHRNAGSGVTSIRKTIPVEGDVSCKRCLKLLAAKEAAAPVETPVEAPAPAEAADTTGWWTCTDCGAKRPTDPTGGELLRHRSVCKGDLKVRALNMVDTYSELAALAKTLEEHEALTLKRLAAEKLAASAGATYGEIVTRRKQGLAIADRPR